MMKSRLVFALLTFTFLLSLTACKDDDVTNPGSVLNPTMANIWPHADGNSWTFEGTYREYPLIAPASPPDTVIPSMSELHADLQQPIGADPTTAFDGLYRLQFDGEVTTVTGVSAQQVRKTFYAEFPTKDTVFASYDAPDDLLRRIADFRPDLRVEIERRLGPAEKEVIGAPSPPLFLGGYAFAYEDSGYYSYGDLDTAHSWIYLAEDLTVGSEFRLQLVPVLADNIWLYGQVWSRGDVTVGRIRFRNVVECMYLVDMGEAVATDENGNVIGTVHNYVYGTTHYAPGVGPIRGLERGRSAGDSTLQDSSPTISDYVMDLIGVAVAD